MLSSSLVGGTVAGVDTTFTAPQCGNGACESGERPDAANGVVGCPADCPLEVVACPSANGAECNGVGQCLSGVCVCGTNQGYTGDACDQCAPGFVPSGLVVGECVVLEVTPSMLVNAPIVSPPKQVRGVVAVVCMCA